MELATGTFPYATWGTPFEQLKQVVKDDAPKLPAGKFSVSFEEFVNKWYFANWNLIFILVIYYVSFSYYSFCFQLRKKLPFASELHATDGTEFLQRSCNEGDRRRDFCNRNFRLAKYRIAYVMSLNERYIFCLIAFWNEHHETRYILFFNQKL